MRKAILLMTAVFATVFANGQNCSGTTPLSFYLSKDFNDTTITSGGWTTQVVVGSTNWYGSDFSGDVFAKITNYSGGANSAAEAWMISPAMDLSAAIAPMVNFQNIANYAGSPLELWISTDYPGTGNPNSNGTWSNLTSLATWDTDLTGWGNWICSGDVDITPYISSTTYIALKYTGSNSDGSTQEIDDIMVFETATAQIGYNASFSSSSASKIENDITLDTVVIELSQAAPAIDTVYVSVNDVTATYGTDYTTTPNLSSGGMFQVLPGDTSIMIIVTMIDDTLYEGNEMFTIAIDSVSDTMLIGSPATLSYTIIDNEVPNTAITSIIDIQTPGAGSDSSLYKGDSVTIAGIVTALRSGTGYWVQKSTGGPFSGIYVFDSLSSVSVSEGDSVIVAGMVDEFFNATQIEMVSSVSIISNSNSFVISNISTNGVNDEQWEGVMIMVDSATCSAAPNQYGEWIINDGSGNAQVDNFMYSHPASVPTMYNVTGVVNYSFGSFEIFPRYTADVDSIGQGVLNLDTIPITAIQTPLNASGDSPFMDSIVTTSGIVVATKPGTGYWIQQAAGGPYSGIYVYDNSNTPVEGDKVVVTAEVVEYFGFTELSFVSTFAVLSSGNSYVITDLSTADVNDEQWESVMVKVTGATCTLDTNQYGEWAVNDGTGDVVVNDFIYVYGPQVGTVYNVTGVVEYNFSEYKILPRYTADIELYSGINANNEIRFAVYPNPVNDMINIVIDNNIKSNIKILDVSGKVIDQMISTKMTNSVSVESLNPGLYFVEVNSGENVRRVKFIKK